VHGLPQGPLDLGNRFRVAAKFRRQELERYGAVAVRVMRLPNLTHAAAAEGLEQLVNADHAAVVSWPAGVGVVISRHREVLRSLSGATAD
jgi:hypothetical protein